MKKILFLVFMFIFAVSVAGCSGDEKSDPIPPIVESENDQQESSEEESVVYLYFGTKEGYLRREARTISGLLTPDRGSDLIEELIKGSQGEDDTLDVIPKGTKILNYTFDEENGLAVIDLSEHIHGATGSMGESLAVYGIVNTLTEIPEIEKVKILVEGEEVESISGHIYLRDPLTRNLELLEGNMLK